MTLSKTRVLKPAVVFVCVVHVNPPLLALTTTTVPNKSLAPAVTKSQPLSLPFAQLLTNVPTLSVTLLYQVGMVAVNTLLSTVPLLLMAAPSTLATLELVNVPPLILPLVPQSLVLLVLGALGRLAV